MDQVQKLEQRMKALEKEITRLNKVSKTTAKTLPAVGKGAQVGAVGVRAFGAAVKTALGPITLALSAVAGLGAAFNTLKAQDFAEAKFKTLGGNADDLVEKLQGVSNELQGQRSVTELTAASYDVASAGFNSAAEAALVLKAASQGATGGFSDLNTVANATTSVLNAYGLEASAAAKLVDQFVQTQNDGKIVVEQYAANIGKVASAAAGLKIPLSEVNAVIAQSTASGVQAEVAFTGLKGALARLASGEASKALEDFGISIDAASLEADGLLGTLKKLEGLDTGTLFKALGTEAGPALLPVIQNLERYEELIKNQENANGVAAQAANTAAGTIEGAWKRVTVAFENLFADQSELGQIIRGTLLAAAATVEILAAAFKLVLVPVRAIISVVGKLLGAFTGIKDSEDALAKFTAGWFKLLQGIERVSDFLLFAADRWGTAIADVAATIVNEFQYWGGQALQIVGNVQDFILGAIGAVSKFFVQAAEFAKGIFAGLWGAINDGAGGVAGNIIRFFGDAFNKVLGLAQSFYNMLPDWLKGAISGGIEFVKGVGDAIGNEIEYTWKASQGAAGSLFGGGGGGQLAVPQGAATPDLGGGGGGGGGGGAANNDAARQLEIQEQQLKKSQEMVIAAEQAYEKALGMTKLQEIELEQKQNIANIQREYSDLIAEAKSEAEELNLNNARALEISTEKLKAEEAIKDLREGALGGIQEEIAALEARVNGTEEVYKLEKQIKDLVADGEGTVSEAQARALVERKTALEEQVKVADELKASYESLADSIAGNLTGAFKDIITGAKSAEEAMADAFQGIADSFLDMAMQMIQEWIKMQLLGIVSGAFGGGSPAGAAGGAGAGGAFGKLFAEGGYVDSPTPALVGEGGEPEYVIPQSKMDSAMSRWSAGQSGGQVLADGGEMVGGGGTALADQPPQINISGGVTQINNEEFIRMDQIPSIIAQSAKAGEAKTLRRLRMSPGARRQTGI